jgi:hypothetical protein
MITEAQVKAVFKCPSVRRLQYLDLIIFIRQKVFPKYAVKRRAIDRTEEANKF